ncbi:LysR family transcriptional regulator [Bradyrhizobium sp. CB2312]|uniref:LysR family transcriptional regulator n=1 Tax=Bradyrhizobium sp. CB2312 TaxID=3039155 RepID=UPI0024B276CD|nr:LysR family transcriptional regulator [Bradyrhizobium sp. CB2312]WFU75442.1 LysR family transcriptional regulator [Bradyrhizobium sp. CB2312]
MPTPTLRQLQFILAANDCGSIRRAADLLSVRHSAMSRSIRELEHTIGISLFERTSSGVRPTKAAQKVLQTARLVFEHLDALVEIAKNDPDGADRVSIGFCTSVPARVARATLTEFTKRFHHLRWSLEEQPRDLLVETLRSRKLDVIVRSGMRPSPETEVLPLWSERIFVWLPEGHALANRAAVYFEDLCLDTILLSRHSPCSEAEGFPLSLVASECLPAIERYNVGIGVIAGLVALGRGVSLVLESEVDLRVAGLTFKELRSESTASSVSFSAEWRTDNENPALQQLLGLLKETYSPKT